LLELGRHAGRLAGAIIRQRHFLAAGEVERAGPADDEDAERHRDDGDHNEAREEAHLAAHAFLPAASSFRSIGRRRSATPVAAEIALRPAGGPPAARVSPTP